MKNKAFLSGQFQANNELIEKRVERALNKIQEVLALNLPQDVPFPKSNSKKDIEDALQKFYEELGCPFFHSLTKKQIKKLSRSQLKAWRLHFLNRLLLILKSQKIGISSICILITLWHALTDCMGMEIIINAQSDEQAKTHAQDLRRILLGSEKYRDYLITSDFSGAGLLKDEVTKIHTIYLHNPKNPRLPTKIIITGMSPSALLSHKRVAFIWSSDITISNLTARRQYEIWGAMLSRLANSLGPCIVECPARAPEGPVFDTWDQFEKKEQNGETHDAKNHFYVEKFKYDLGIRDGFFTQEFIDAEKIKLGPLFGALYEADFFASGSTWYKEGHFANISDDATNLLLEFHPTDDRISDVTDD